MLKPMMESNRTTARGGFGNYPAVCAAPGFGNPIASGRAPCPDRLDPDWSRHLEFWLRGLERANRDSHREARLVRVPHAPWVLGSNQRNHQGVYHTVCGDLQLQEDAGQDGRSCQEGLQKAMVFKLGGL